MGIIFATGFDHYSILNQRFETQVGSSFMSVAAGAGRNGTDCLKFTNGNQTWITKSLGGNYSEVWLAFAFRQADLSQNATWTIAQFADTATVQLSLVLTNTGDIQVKRGSTILGVAARTTILNNIWYHIEWSVKFHSSTGTVKLWVNGILVLDLSGQNTIVSANTYANQALFVAVGNNVTVDFRFDDIVISDSAHIGDVAVRTYLPSSAGVTDQWVASSLTTFQSVDDTAPNSNADYASSANSGDLSLWTYTMSLAGNTNIVGVQTLPNVEKTDAGTGVFLSTLRVEGVNYQPGSAQAPSNGSYLYFPEIFLTYPGTTAPWSLTHVLSMQVGIQRTA